MQNTYVSVLLLLSTCFIQFSFVHSEIPKVDGLNSNAKHIIVNLQIQVQIESKIFLNTLHESRGQCTVQKQEAIEGAKSKLNVIIADAQKQCEGIKEKAEKNGTDISQYFANIEISLKGMYYIFLQKQYRYVNNETDNGLSNIDEAIKFIQNCLKIVADLPNKLKDCGNNTHCIEDLIAEVGKLKKNMLAQIAKKVKEATTFINELKEGLKLYAATQIVKEALNAAKEIVANFFKYVRSISQSSGHLPLPIPGGNISILVAQTKSAIACLGYSLKFKIEASLKSLIQFKNQCTTQGQEAIEESKSKLNITIAEAQNHIEAIKKKAHENGKDISECLVDVKSSFKKVIEKFLKGQIHCVTNEINEAINIINSIIKIISGYSKELEYKLMCCGTRIHCVQNLILEISKLENSLPVEITKKVNEVALFLVGLKSRFEFCTAVQIGKGALNAAKAVVKNVIKCATRITKLPFDHLPEGNIDNLTQHAKNDIEKLKNTTQNLIQNALKDLNKLKNQCTAQGNDTIEESKPTLNKTIADAQLLIEEIKKKAQKKGTNISKCLVNVKSSFKEILSNCQQNVIYCVTEHTTKTLYIINDAIVIISESAKGVSVLAEKLKACGTSPCAPFCIKNLIEEVAEFEANLRCKIAREIAESTLSVAGLQFKLEMCAAIQIGREAYNSAIEVVENVEKCSSIPIVNEY